MSWIRSALHKAVEVGGNGNLTRVVRGYADTVVNQAGQAVVGGAKLIQDRLVIVTIHPDLSGARTFQNYKLAVKRLEEVSVSCRGPERVLLLRRWLIGLKEIQGLNEAIKSEHLDQSSESNDPPTNPNVIMYYGPELGGDPMNFRDMFLRSQALEGITLSLILEEPSEEELTLLLQIFRLCLLGENETQDVIVSYIRDLAKAFSTYDEEVLAKREEMLQYAQDAIAGLKVNAEIVRIDSEVSNTHTKLDDMKNHLPFSDHGEDSSEKASDLSTENLNEALAHFKLCYRLEELLLQKKHITNGDSTTSHAKKLEKLKILSESLASSTLKAEKRISDNRMQKEEALRFRVNKTSEMGEIEKELTSEIKVLHNRKEELEEELKKVMTALTSANGRLHIAREERDQFDEANDQIIQHFKLKDDELLKSVASARAEAEVCNTYVNFLETTWVYQSSYADQKEKLVNDELKKHGAYFMDWAISFLSAQKEEMASSISSIRDIVETMKGLDGIPTTKEKNDEVNPRKSLEEQYHIQTAKLITALSLADSIKKHFFTQQDEDSRNSITRLNELLHSIEKFESEFESMKKPHLEHEVQAVTEEAPPEKPRTPGLPFLSPKQLTPNEMLELNPQSNLENKPQRGISLGFNPIALPLVRNRSTAGRKPSDAEAQWSKMKMELELDEGYSRRNSMDGNFDWEFDEKVEKQPRKSVS